MPETTRTSYFGHLAEDIPAGVVSFLIALPLCLGIALASGAPLLSGIVTGIVAGLVVSWASGSQLSISGPAAGLTVIVGEAIQSLGSYSLFLDAVILAGLFQILLGLLRAGNLSAYVPVAVLKGMLAAIGLNLILKQVPHALGYDVDFEGDERFLQLDDHTTLTELLYSLSSLSTGAAVVSGVAILILLLWETRWIRSSRLARLPGPLVVVAWGLLWQGLAASQWPDIAIQSEHMVNLPTFSDARHFLGAIERPDFSGFLNPETYHLAATLALIASIESLINIEAVDKLDPLRRIVPGNRELKAQGLGNLVAGLFGGLPMTALVVRSSANIDAGAKTKMAAFTHGLLLLVSALFLGPWLNHIPLAALAAILIVTGYRLARPRLFKEMYLKGSSQIVPFLITLFAILFTDILTGMALGMLVGLYYVIRTNFHSSFSLTQNGPHYLLRLKKDASFLNKAPLRKTLQAIERGAYVILDGSRAQFIDRDILETFEDFFASARASGIRIEIKGIDELESRYGRLLDFRDPPA